MKIWFDEVEITQLFDDIDVKRDVMPERTNYGTAVPSRHGEYYTGHRYGVRQVDVEFLIIADDLNSLQAIKKGIAFMLDIDRPAKLVFSDEPDRFLYAVLDGQTQVDEILRDGKGMLTFICHDPFYYSDTEKEFLADATDLLKIDNFGTAPTSPKFELEFPNDCGFVALVSPAGVIQIGEPEQVDAVPIPRSERLLNTNMEALTGWTYNSAANTKTLTPNSTIGGTFKINGFMTSPATYGNTGPSWHGPSMRRTLPAAMNGDVSSQYFETTIWFNFKSLRTGQVVTSSVRRDLDAEQKGVFEFNVMDDSNNFLAGVRMMDQTVYHDMTVPEFWVGNTRVWREDLTKPAPRREKYTYREGGKVKTGYRNVYASDVGKWNDMAGFVKITKFNHRITFDLQKIGDNGRVEHRKTMTVRLDAGQHAQKGRHLQAWFGKFPNYPVMDTWGIRHLDFTKHNTDTELDVPNTFKSGDKLLIDCESSQAYLNGGLFMDKVDIGSEFFEVISGETEVQLMHSRFGRLRPSFKASIREKWL